MDKNAPGEGINELEMIMKQLRSPDGCPWDREQTHHSLMPHLMEEAGEFLDAIDERDDIGMCEELGDLLMHVLLHSVMAEERGAFTLNDVIRGIIEKMYRRHPHVFGDEHANVSGEVARLWERVKKAEKGDSRKSILDGIPRHCPALLQAEKIQRKAAKVGFDWNDEKQILEKIDEELGELHAAYAENDENHIDEELGDLLFAIANLSRFRKRRSAERLLADANNKFSKRFRHIEKVLTEQGKTLEEASLEEMEALWLEAKRI